MNDVETINIRPPVWALIAAVAVGGAFYLAGKNMELRAPVTQPMQISVTGEGKVAAAPDIAVLNFGVTTGRQSTAKAAIENIRKNMDSVLAAVDKAGVEKKDITTQSFWLNPVYDYTNGTQVLRGYEATQSLSVKVRDLDKVGEVLGVATNAGANQANGINFSIDNSDKLKAEAREIAIGKAKAKAQELADGLGMKLIQITGFSEDGAYSTPPMPYMMKTEAYGGDVANQARDMDLSIPAGEQEIRSNVTITYEIR